jgi:hypothetical protein
MAETTGDRGQNAAAKIRERAFDMSASLLVRQTV